MHNIVPSFYYITLSSADESDAESSEVKLEVDSDKLAVSQSNCCDRVSVAGLFKCQYMILAVSVSIIFWFT